MNFLGPKGVTLLALFTDLNDMSSTVVAYGVCECGAVRVLAYFPSDGAKEVFEANTANAMSANTHFYHGTYPVFENKRI